MPVPAPHGRDAPGLHRKLLWLNLYRLALNTVLLGGTAAMSLRSRRPGDGVAELLYALALVTFVAALGVALSLRRGRGLRPLAWIQLGTDLGIAAVIVALTGRTESVFVFLYLLAIVNGAVVLYRRGAIAATLAAVGLHLVAGLWLGSQGAPSTLFVQIAAFLATGALASYLSDILRTTDERLAARESDLAAITALHESIVQSVTSGLVTLDHAGVVTFLNRAGEQMTGLSAAEVVGRPAPKEFQTFGTETARGEAAFTAASGQVLRLGYSSFPLLRDGRRIGAAVIFQDLTQLRAMEERVLRSERLADLGGIAAGLAHELRNPLAAIMGSVELLREGGDARLLDIVLREAGRLEKLVEQFLAFARPAEPRRTRMDLCDTAAEALDLFAHDPLSARTRIQRDLRPAPTMGDPDQIRQVLWNLIRNAAQAIEPRGGEIRIATRADGPGDAVLVVEDDGPGIAPADRERIFLPFYSTRSNGSGLGLATVHRIIDAHGGSVTVDSAPGAGARFVVRLPQAALGLG
jgi:two-component system sensor histidine kinase PilS (NtrC family)